MSLHPTPYPEINTVLSELLSAVQTILGEQFVGLYLYGSLALGDFHPNRSDIDFVAVTTSDLLTPKSKIQNPKFPLEFPRVPALGLARASSPLPSPNPLILAPSTHSSVLSPQSSIPALSALHEHLSAAHARWGHELEGYYIPQTLLRRFNPADATYPHIERGGQLQVEADDSGGIIQRYILREHGVTLAGPPPHTLIDPILPIELQQATAAILYKWWQPQLTDHSNIQQPGYQVYAILTMCRVLYTLQHAAIISKPAAAHWAIATLDPRFSTLITEALAWENGMPMNHLAETVDLIRYTLERTRLLFQPDSPGVAL